MTSQEIWLTICLMGVVTYFPRLIPVTFLSQVQLPNWLKIWLTYIPTSIFGALIFSEIFLRGEKPDFSLENPYLWASMLAFIIALKSESLPATIGVGCVSFWILQQYLFL